ncbi:MAG: iron ABC transporter permease [Magnetococcales bacterium]|nr:iron ABC transporter permease [Magnetococcales bacterium]
MKTATRFSLPLVAPGWGWGVAVWMFALIVTLPLLVILSAWLTPDWKVWRHLVETVLGELLVNTLILMWGVSLLVLLLGVGLAWLTAMCSFPGQRFFDWALILPMAIPAYVLAFTVLGFLDYGGPIQSWLIGRFGAHGYWFPDTRSPAMVVTVLSLTLYPYVYMLARGAFLSQGQRMLEASRMLGRSVWGSFFHAALPMARPAMAAGCALAVMEALADFGAVSVFGFNTFTTAIYKAWFGLFSLHAATQLASLLLVFVCCALVIERRMRGRARYFAGDGHGGGVRIPLRGFRGVLATLFAGSVFAFAFVLPMGQLGVWAWGAARGDMNARYWDLVTHTLLLGCGAALVTTVGALLMGIARKRRPDRIMRVAARVATLGYAMPGSVLAVGVMLTLVWLDKGLAVLFRGVFGEGSGSFVSGSILALLFAYLVRFLAVAYGPVESGLERIRPSIPEAAHSLGSGNREVLRRIYLPMLRPSLLTALLLVLVEVMKEMPATLLLRPFGWDTLSVRIYEMTSEGEWERAALPAVTLVLAGLLPVMLLVRKTARH